ncbi:MAG: sodium:calcium antiporter [Nitrospiraceae bacterium]
MTLWASAGLFLASIVITLGACTLFTNGIEWFGKRRKISEGAIGSIFAAVGTTLPETSIPLVAIFFGTGQERTEVGLGAILGAPFMLSTLVLPILAFLLLLYARLGKRDASFKVDYHEVRVDLLFFLLAYSLAVGCAFVVSRPLHYLAAVLLIASYVYYMRLKFAGTADGELELEPLIFAPKRAVPTYGLIAAQAIAGLIGLAIGAHLFVTAARGIADNLHVSPLILSLLIAPLATELPEMSNSFLWLYRKKDTLAVGNVTGAMVFQGTFPVSIGLIGTEWSLAPSAMATMGLALAASGVCLVQLLWGGHWRPWLVGGGIALYLGYTLSLYRYGF